MSQFIGYLLKSFFEATIEFFFPYFCVGCNKKDTLLCQSCFEQIEFFSFELHKQEQLPYLDKIIVVSKYQGVVKKLIHEFKYKGVIDIGKVIGKIFFRCANIPRADFLVPIPIHNQKRKQRGFNQSEEIAQELSKHLKIPVANFLEKTINTKSQMSIRNKSEREKNLIGSFEINPMAEKYLSENQNLSLILVDDVITTGSTLNECAKILKQSGIKKVNGLVLAQR